ncbi:cold-shock protein [Candidatus Magnetoovum chiemensis]|nr:cold-shock protein [Candidatus Magnetoovum chiemensis]
MFNSFKEFIYYLRSISMAVEGKVKWFNKDKGYGFLTKDDGEDIFVHYTAINGKGFRTLVEGQRVTFEIVNDHKGLKATNVSALD